MGCLCLLHLLHTRWLHAWSLPLFLLLNLSLPLPASLSHPSDEKEHSSHFPRNISAASLGSLIGHHHNNSANHAHQPEPWVTDPLMGGLHTSRETDVHVDLEKNDVQVRLLKRRGGMRRFGVSLVSLGMFTTPTPLQLKEPTLASGMHRSKSKHELKLLEKIPENAEATVVLVGQWSSSIASIVSRDDYVCALTLLSPPPPSRLRGLPGAAHHGLCAAAGGGGAGVRSGGACAGPVPLCPAGSSQLQHGLPPDWPFHRHTHV